MAVTTKFSTLALALLLCQQVPCGAAGATQGQCSSGWLQSPSKHCYRFLDVQANFYDCQKKCESYGGSLACVRDKADNEFMKGLVGSMKTFIGYTDRLTEGKWEWIAQGCSSTFTAWQPGEPNNYGKGEDCATMPIWHSLSGSQWNDEQCQCGRGCLCEKNGLYGTNLTAKFLEEQFAGAGQCWDAVGGDNGGGGGGGGGGIIFFLVFVIIVVGGGIIGTGLGLHLCRARDKLKAISVSGGGAGFFSFACLIIAIASFAHRPPSDEEAAASGCEFHDKWWEAHSFAMVFFGLLAMILGILGLLGACLSIMGVRQRNHCCLISSSIIFGINGTIAILIFLGSLGQLGEGSRACPNPCKNAGDDEKHCCWGEDCACRAAIMWACETWSIGMAALVAMFFLGLLAIMSSACGCGATCCCKEAFGMQPPDLPGPQGTGMGQQGTVIGQPVFQQSGVLGQDNCHGNAVVVKAE